MLKQNKNCHSKIILVGHRHLKSNSAITSSNNSIIENNIPEIIFHVPYSEKLGKQLLELFFEEI